MSASLTRQTIRWHAVVAGAVPRSALAIVAADGTVYDEAFLISVDRVDRSGGRLESTMDTAAKNLEYLVV
jgi:hypothetical protein